MRRLSAHSRRHQPAWICTGVHPETYPVVEQHLGPTRGKPIGELMGRAELLQTLRPEAVRHTRSLA